jgi:hypothetical protein
MEEKGHGRKGSWNIGSYNLSICLEEGRKATKKSPSRKQTSWSEPLELESGARPQDHHGTLFLEPSYTTKLKTHYSSFFEKLVVLIVNKYGLYGT